MIQFVCGIKGSGKTKHMVSMANECIEQAAGHVVFIDDTAERRFEIHRSIRFINVGEYQIDSQERLLGFLAGLLAGDYDIKTVFIDHFLRILKTNNPAAQEEFLCRLDSVLEPFDVQIIVSVSADTETLPAYFRERLV